MRNPMGRGDLPPEHVEDVEGRTGRTVWSLGSGAGSERLYVDLVRLQPGVSANKYHSHSCQEEFFYVLAGYPTLKLDEKVYRLAPGTFFAKPAGQGIAHQLSNDTSEPCEILDIGTRDPEDICVFPDEGVAVVKSLQKVFSLESGIKGWLTQDRPSD